ncbi:MAG: aminopeptidase P N-terminal domain-containing protein [Candidatus Acidiferrales bacterium]
MLSRRLPALRCGLLILALALCATTSAGDRDVRGEYLGRRARLAAELNTPVVLFGYEDVSFGLSDPERKSPESTFRQEENFYYLTGHREEGAALLLVPPTAEAKAAGLPVETLYLPPRDKRRESWDGARLGPDDPGIGERTGFARVKPVSELKGDLERAAKVFPKMNTLAPRQEEGATRTHAGHWLKWLKEALPKTEFENARAALGRMRQVKSPREQELLRVAIERSMDAHREAMKAMRPGMHEYEIASLMAYTFERAGCERPGYPPIVGSGPNSTVLHYAEPRRQMQAGEVVVIDVAGECAGYTADITRTLPTGGTFSARQREIYEIVLGAQNAAIAAVKPGMTMAREGKDSLYKIAFDYINTHGKDSKGEPLGKYFIHGLGHHIGLQVHDAGDPNRPLEPGMILTIEPGIYIPEENLGVRIEDIVLVTETGAVLLTASLPRTVEEVESAMVPKAEASRGR